MTWPTMSIGIGCFGSNTSWAPSGSHWFGSTGLRPTSCLRFSRTQSSRFMPRRPIHWYGLLRPTHQLMFRSSGFIEPSVS
ncbi:hypothetical protein D3C79_903520 [compost metagenome]